MSRTGRARRCQTAEHDGLTILCWYWRQADGRTNYTAEHVNIWYDMLRRNITLPSVRFACVTDDAAGIDKRIEIIDPPREFEEITLPTWGPEKPQCLRRISMFRPDAGSIFGKRFACLDIDCIVAGNLDSLFTRQEEIVLYQSPPASPFNLAPRPYNGSMVMMTAGCRPQVYERLTADGARMASAIYCGSDQSWISHILGPGEATWGERDGVVWYGRWQEGVVGRLMFFPGSPKPWDLLVSHEFARLHYHSDRGGRCLVLGYGPTVWDDADAALNAGPFDYVIASPEAADHLSAAVDMIAQSDSHADALVKMIGFDEVRFCGRTETP